LVKDAVAEGKVVSETTDKGRLIYRVAPGVVVAARPPAPSSEPDPISIAPFMPRRLDPYDPTNDSPFE
jgi:hypothetical protein